jgi:FAT domain
MCSRPQHTTAAEPQAYACGPNTAALQVREVWRTRLMGVERSVDVWTQLLAVRKLVVPPRDDADIYTKYAVMCRKEARAAHGWRTLVDLLGYDPTKVEKGRQGYGAGSGNPMVRRPCTRAAAHMPRACVPQPVSSNVCRRRFPATAIHSALHCWT